MNRTNEKALAALSEILEIADGAYYQNGEQHEYAKIIREDLTAAPEPVVNVEALKREILDKCFCSSTGTVSYSDTIDHLHKSGYLKTPSVQDEK